MELGVPVDLTGLHGGIPASDERRFPCVDVFKVLNLAGQILMIQSVDQLTTILRRIFKTPKMRHV